jgi:hypothetical protein
MPLLLVVLALALIHCSTSRVEQDHAATSSVKTFHLGLTWWPMSLRGFVSCFGLCASFRSRTLSYARPSNALHTWQGNALSERAA